MTLRLLAVHAHPDDESSKGAATAAAYRARGARVMVVSCTGGERGSILNASLADDPGAQRDMAGFRRGEMARARAIVDVEHTWLGYRDSGMPDEGEPLPRDAFASVPLEISTRPLVRVFRAFRPHVVVTYDENGGYPHPDHIRAHQVGVAAFEQSGDPDAHPGTGAPWTPSKLYYDRTFSVQKLRALHAALTDSGHPRAADLDEMLEWVRDRPELPITTRVPVGEYLELRDAALRAHASQVAPGDRFFFWPNDVLRTAWPTDDYELVRSTVPSTLPEDDLFAGITDEES